MPHSEQHQQYTKGIWVSDRLFYLIADGIISPFDALVFGYFHSFLNHSGLFSQACNELPFRRQKLLHSIRKLKQLGMVTVAGKGPDRVVCSAREHLVIN